MTRDIYVLTEEEISLLPTDEEVMHYKEHGWYISKPLLNEEEITQLEKASDFFYQHGPDRLLPSHPGKLAYWQKKHGDIQRHHDYIAYESHNIGRILKKPLIGAVAAKLSGSQEIRIYQSTMIYKPANAQEVSNIVPWHFDKHYWSTSSSSEMLTAFIAFHDCAEENGTITMIDGSHLWEELPHDSSVNNHFAKRKIAELEEILQANAEHNHAQIKKIPMNIKKGQMSFHHCRIYHGSGANLAGYPRRAISLHLQPGDNHWVESYNADGDLNSYNHDFVVAKDSNGRPDYADPEFCPTLWKE